MKKTTLLLFILSFFNLHSQNIKDQLENIKTLDQAEKFISTRSDLTAEIIAISPEIDSLSSIANYKIINEGQILEDTESIYKIISVKKLKAFRVSYIYLDGKKLSMNEINKLRPEIINQYKKGISFSELANKYTMDGNTTGDLNWFTEGSMVPEFESAVKNHQKNEIFFVDIPYNKWYYVTLKTYENKEIRDIIALKIKTSR